MSSDRIPRPVSEWVGPDGHRLDVADWTPRQINIHALDTALRALHDIGMLKRGLRLELDDHDARLRVVEGGKAMAPPPPVRDPDSSWHDYDAEWERARREVREMVKDPARPAFDSERAKAVVQKALAEAKTASDAGHWRTATTLPAKVGWKVVEALVALAVGGGAVELWHWLGH